MKRLFTLTLGLFMVVSLVLFPVGCGKQPQTSSTTLEAEYVCPNCQYSGVIGKWEKKSETNYICPNCGLEVSLDVQKPSEQGQENTNSTESTNGQSSAESNDKTPGKNPSTGTVGQNSKPAQPIPPSKVDLKGYQINIVSNWANLWNPKDGASAAGDKMLEAYERLEEKYGVKINITYAPHESMVRDITASIHAGKKYADVIHMEAKVFNSLARNGIFEPVNNLKELNINDPIYNRVSKEFATYKGVQYGVSWSSHLDYQGPSVLFYNASMMQRMGQPNLLQMVKNGTWTWEKFRQICSDVQKKDPTVKGFGSIDSLSCMVGWARSNGVKYLSEKNGKYVTPGNDPAFLAGLQFAQTINADNIVYKNNPDDYTKWPETILPQFKNGKVLFAHLDYYVGKDFLVGKMKDKFGVVPFPKGPNAKAYYGMYTNVGCFAFLKGAKNNDKASRLLYLIAKETYNDNIKAEYGRSFTDKDSIEMLRIMENNPLVDTAIHIDPYNAFLFPELGKVARGEETPQACVSRISAKAQSILDDFFKQK